MKDQNVTFSNDDFPIKDISVNDANTTDRFRGVDVERFLISSILTTTISVLSLIGNSLIISSICYARKRSVFMKAKLSLAISDITFCLSKSLNVAYGILIETSEYHTKATVADLRIIAYSMSSFFQSASGCTLVLISLQRLYAIKYPIRYKKIRGRKQNLFIALAWLPSFVYILIFFLNTYKRKLLELQIITFSLFALIPILIIGVSSISLLYVYYTNIAKSNISDGVAIGNRREHFKFVMMTLLMVAGYDITYIPFIVSYFMSLLENEMAKDFGDTTFETVAILLLNFSSIVNILIYSILDKQFQLHVKYVFGKINSCDASLTSLSSAYTINTPV